MTNHQATAKERTLTVMVVAAIVTLFTSSTMLVVGVYVGIFYLVAISNTKD